MKLSFFGGAKAVTGANYLLEHDGLKILIDCGMYQGLEFVPNANYDDFPYNPKDVDFLFATHSHIDHIGRIPKLVRDGFRGDIIMTEPAVEISQLSLRDSVKLIHKEANKRQKEPFFNEDDVKACDQHFKKHKYGEVIDLKGKAKLELFNAGHILGSAMGVITIGDKKIGFSGDLGNSPAPLIGAPDKIGEVDYFLIESAYGDREHGKAEKSFDLFKKVVLDTISRGGTLIIPSFAIERTQILLFYLNNLIENNEMPKVSIYVDSPLAQKVTKVYKDYEHYFKESVQGQINSGDQIFDFPSLVMTESVEESKQINDDHRPKIILAGNGMSNGGRILHHEMRYLRDKKSTILIVGYQVDKSIGRQLLDGAKSVNIYGKKIPVNAQVHEISSFSAHADNPQLKSFVQNNIDNKPKKIFVVQGEENAAWQLAQDLNDLGYDALAPDYKDFFEL